MTSDEVKEAFAKLEQIRSTPRPAPTPGEALFLETMNRLEALPKEEQDKFWEATYQSALWYRTPFEDLLKKSVDSHIIMPVKLKDEARWYAKIWGLKKWRRTKQGQVAALKRQKKTQGQIALALGISVDAVKKHWRRARKPKSK